MTKLITIYWRDIPSQVIAKQGRKSVKIQLSNRFQICIDKAAMRAGRVRPPRASLLHVGGIQ